jgi:hypothetical protein
MILRTIWTLRGLPLKERLARTRDSLASSIGGHLPLRIRYWVTLQEIGHATAKSPNVPATPLDYVLQHLAHPKNLS